jgi:hypothetical protein
MSGEFKTVTRIVKGARKRRDGTLKEYQHERKYLVPIRETRGAKKQPNKKLLRDSLKDLSDEECIRLIAMVQAIKAERSSAERSANNINESEATIPPVLQSEQNSAQ